MKQVILRVPETSFEGVKGATLLLRESINGFEGQEGKSGISPITFAPSGHDRFRETRHNDEDVMSYELQW